jgi:quercetin dioxygenase-like cupin family protein
VVIMDKVELKSFDKADETRQFQGKGWADFVNVGGREIVLGHFEPGWRWSENVKPVAQTDLCEFPHLGYMLKGRMRVTLKDGSEAEMTEGDVVAIPPGHDAEVIGDEEAVFVDFGGQLSDYALPK